MVVDDAALMRGVIRSLLEESGRYEVVGQYENGKDALAALGDLSPDIVLLDVEMPVMDGAAFLRHARVKTRARIVILSAASALGTARSRELRRWGADAITDKPAGAVSLDLTVGDPLLDVLDRIAA